MVLQDSQPVRIAGHEVVCGDVLLLAEVDRIAADAVLLDGADVQVDESLLTGEAVPVDKDARANAALFSGTLLVRGHGRARVTANGERSEIGRIGHALGTLGNEPSPLKQQNAHLLNVLALLALAASVLVLALAHGWIRGDWLAALLAGIALAMAMLPQELTVVLTVLPALGAWRLAQKNVLTRRIAAIETLGRPRSCASTKPAR
jgi:Ca2+-transporting ATPase